MDKKLKQSNPYNSPLLGADVDVKNYSRRIQSGESMPTSEPIQTESTTTDLPPPPPEKDMSQQQPNQQQQTQQAQQQETFKAGTNYQGDGVDDYSKVEQDVFAQQQQEFQQASETKISSKQADIFSRAVVKGFQMYVPELFVALSVRVSGVRERDINYHLDQHNIDKDFADLYYKNKKQLKEDLKITDEEAELLQEALHEYLVSQNIQAATPGNTLLITAGLILTRLTIVSIQRGAEDRSRWQQLFREKGIRSVKDRSYTPEYKPVSLNKNE